MNKKLIILTLIIGFTVIGASKPQIQSTDLQQNRIGHGDQITFGVQFQDSERSMDYATANLKLNGEKVGVSPLYDRNNDGFYVGSFGSVKGGEVYTVEVKGCNHSGSCTAEKFQKRTYCTIGILGSCLA